MIQAVDGIEMQFPRADPLVGWYRRATRILGERPADRAQRGLISSAGAQSAFIVGWDEMWCGVGWIMLRPNRRRVLKECQSCCSFPAVSRKHTASVALNSSKSSLW